MKRIVSFLLAFSLLCALFCTAGNAIDDDIDVFLDGDVLFFDVPPRIINDRTMVPMRVIFEALNATVEWIPETRQIRALCEDKDVVFTVDSNTYTINFIPHSLDVPPQIVSDRTLVPLRAVSESLGCTVDWDGERRAVVIATENWDPTGWTIPSKTQLWEIENEKNLLAHADMFEMNDYLNRTEDYLRYHQVKDSAAALFVEGEAVNTHLKSIDDRTMVIAEDILDAVGATFSWEKGSDTMYIDYGSRYVIVTANSSTIIINSVQKPAYVPAVLYEEKMYLPLRMIAEIFDYTVTWDAEANAVRIASSYVAPLSALPYEDHEAVPDPASVWTFSSVTVSPNRVQYRYPLSEFTDEKQDQYMTLLDTCGFTRQGTNPLQFVLPDVSTVQIMAIEENGAYYRVISVYDKAPTYRFDPAALTYYTTFADVPDFGSNVRASLQNSSAVLHGFAYSYLTSNQEAAMQDYREMLLCAGFSATSSRTYGKELANGDVVLVTLVTPDDSLVTVEIQLYTKEELYQ